ncbi:MAG: PQQ-dependent sugar dehydrogenase [Candidatus Eisenbacteria bacterium]
MLLRRSVLVAAAFLACVFAAHTAHAVTSALVKVPTGFVDDSLVAGLALPRAFTFLPDGRMLVIEHKTARIRMIVGQNHIATTDPILTVAGVNTTGYERGTQGIAVDPGWPARPYVYVFYNGTDGFNHLVRYTASGQLSNAAAESITLGSLRQIISDIPDVDPNHQAGCIRFGPDGKLFVSLGEDEQWCTAQDSTSLRGQFLRIDVNNVPATAGAQPPRALIIPASGNPLSTPDSNAKLVWAYGFRNPWTFSIDPTNGRIYSADVGEQDEEELDEVLPGRNYGWPYREGLDTVLPRTTGTPSQICPEPGGAGNPANGYTDPIVAYHRDLALHSIFSLGFYRAVQGAAANWPAAYRGTTFWGDYYYGQLHLLTGGTGNWHESPAVPGQPGAYWGTGFRAMVDAAVGPDGSLYWLQQINTTNLTGTVGVLHRIRYTGATTDVPVEVPLASRLRCAPNPVRGTGELAFRLTQAGAVKIALYDVNGRRVTSLYDGHAPAGETRVPLEVASVAPGLYFAKLSAAGREDSERVLVLR